MQHGVAVWADGDEIGFWVDKLFALVPPERTEMVHMDKALSNRSVRLGKVKIADLASQSTIIRLDCVGQTLKPQMWFPLVAVRCYLPLCTFKILTHSCILR